jgi:hypothetical protein
MAHEETNTKIIKVGIKEADWKRADWIDLAQDKDRSRCLVNAVTKLRVP